MDAHMLGMFALAFLVFAASPGPDNVTIVARTLHQGPMAGLAYGAGTVTGILVFLVLAATGLSILADEMAGVMTWLRTAGAIWLVWMGVRLWRAPAAVPNGAAMSVRRGALRDYLTGLTLNLGNLKMPLFYLALLPNLVGPNLRWAEAGQLALVILAVEAVVVGGHVLLANHARTLLRSPRVVRRVNRTAGGLMVGAGLATVAVR